MTPDEPAITINGIRLNQAQAMTVRVALGAFLMTLVDDPVALGNDQLGRDLAAGYRSRLSEINAMITSRKED